MTLAISDVPRDDPSAIASGPTVPDPTTLADARVGGVRVHAVLPPVSGGGTLLSLRIPAAATPSLAALADGWPDGALWADALEALR